MMKTKLILLGTSHISPESVKKIKKLIKEEKPDVVCIELDENRYHAIMNKEKISLREAAGNLGIGTGLMAWLASKIQQSLGHKTGIMAGEEMITAVEEAKKAEIDYEFIDRDIIITMEKLRKISFWEKVKIFSGLLLGSITSVFSRRDWSKVPEDEFIDDAIEQIKDLSPQLYKVLIEDRDFYMSSTILEIIDEKEPEKILAVVGAGHKKHMKKILSNSESIESIRLE